MIFPLQSIDTCYTEGHQQITVESTLFEFKFNSTLSLFFICYSANRHLHQSNNYLIVDMDRWQKNYESNLQTTKRLTKLANSVQSRFFIYIFLYIFVSLFIRTFYISKLLTFFFIIAYLIDLYIDSMYENIKFM